MSADYYDVVCAALGTAGFSHYEVSNFAKPGHESQHNLAYWHGADYVGVGPGAHGRMTVDGKRAATIAHLAPRAYSASVLETGSGIDSQETLSQDDWAAEYLLMGLRIEAGISLSKYRKIAGQDLNEIELRHLMEDGLLIRDGDRLMASTEGRLVLNRVTENLLLA